MGGTRRAPAGDRGPELDSLHSSRYWRELVPLKVTGMVEVTTLQALEPLVGMGSLRIYACRFCAQKRSPGTILARTEDQALLIVQKRGRGEVVFAAFDPGRAPLTAWDGTALLWKTLFRLDDTPNYWKLRRELRETFEESWIAQALQLPLLSFPSHLLLAVFLVLYASTIGFFFWRVGLEQPSLPRETWMLIGLTLSPSAAGRTSSSVSRISNKMPCCSRYPPWMSSRRAALADVETHLALLSTRKQTYDLKIAGQPSTWLQIVPPMTRDLPLDWHLHQDQVLTIKDIFVAGLGRACLQGQGVAGIPHRDARAA